MTWQAAPPSGLFGYDEGSSQAWASGDGGQTWTASTVPGGVASPVLAAALGGGAAYAVELSSDAGQHWSGQSLGTAPVCTVSMLGGQVWLYCLTGDATWSLRSADGGATWLAYRLPAPAGQAPGIFLTGAGSAVMPIGGALWRTSDGGKAWVQSWALPR